jgi:hypothetical protein
LPKRAIVGEQVRVTFRVAVVEHHRILEVELQNLRVVVTGQPRCCLGRSLPRRSQEEDSREQDEDEAGTD